MAIRITPSILNADFSKLNEEILKVSSVSDLIHLDIMDNKFVPNFTFDFDQRISLSLIGKVGTRLKVNANYDTQSTFDFQNLFNFKHSVLKKIQEYKNYGNTKTNTNERFL